INWFSPLVWKIAQTLVIEREKACDDQVLNWGTKSSDYAVSLLEISRAIRHKSGAPVLAMAQTSDLANRIRSILDLQQSRHPLNRTRCLSLLILVALLVLPLSTLQFSRAAAQNPSIVLSVTVPSDVKSVIGESVFKDFETAHPGVTVKM